MSELKIREDLELPIKRILIKLSSRAMTLPQGGVDAQKMKNLVQDIVKIQKAQIEVLVVTSGAIHSARGLHPHIGQEMADLQALSAIGQPFLMSAYAQNFSAHSVGIAQILLTHEDLKNSKRRNYFKATCERLFKLGIIPIINENDAVSTEEISFGDNDHLAASVGVTMGCSLLIMLTGAPGLIGKDGKKIDLISPDRAFQRITMKSSPGTKGGIVSKLQAIEKCREAAMGALIAPYDHPHPLCMALEELSWGTLFLPGEMKKPKDTLLITSARRGAIISIDQGAAVAMEKKNSLLPKGILKVRGVFTKGDVVTVKYRQKVIGHGVVQYEAQEIDKIKGKKTQEIEKILGSCPSQEVIHRDSFFLARKK